MKKLFCSIIAVIALTLSLVSTQAFAESKTLTWDAPITNEDGTSLSDLAGYKVYNNLVEVADVGNVLTYTLDVVEGSHDFTVTAYDTAGNESVHSVNVIYELQICPAPPSNLAIQ